jgi:hypothetical protein
VLSLAVQELGKTTWSGSVGVLPAVLWCSVPPLVLWLLWLVARPKRERVAA